MDTSSINLLIFPLIGGYFIVTRSERFAYINQRLSDQAILFNSILVGIPLLIVSLTLSSLLNYYAGPFVLAIKTYFPVKDKYFGTCILSFLLAVIGTYLINFRLNESAAIQTAVRRIGNELELLFVTSVTESQLIQMTLRNDKVYIGWVQLIPKPGSFQFVKIIPLLSGYRDEAKELILTTNYSEVYSSYIQKGRINDIRQLEMNLVIRVDEIISASRFDFEVWEHFEKNRQQSQSRP